MVARKLVVARARWGVVPILLAMMGCGDDGGGGGGIDAAVGADADVGCTSSTECAGMAATPVCDVASGACVQCTSAEAAACTGETPVCGVNEQCRGCRSHDECPADSACILEGDGAGACAAADVTFHVALGGDDTEDCLTPATACATLPGVAGKVAVATPSVVRIGPGLHTAAGPTLLLDKLVRVYGAGEGMTTLDRSNNGVIIRVTEESDVTVADLTVTGASGPGVAAIELVGGGFRPNLLITRATVGPNATRGVSMTGGDLALEDVRVLSNTGTGVTAGSEGLAVSRLRVVGAQIMGNGGGGLDVSCEFEVVNTVLARNGGLASTVGGARFTNAAARPIFRFNTIALNEVSAATPGAGIECGINPIVFDTGFNLVYRNFRGDVPGAGSQTSGNPGCLGAGSLVDVSAGNPLGFVEPDNVPFNFHLSATSPATVVDAGGVTCMPALDLDLQTRPAGAGCDLGADEFTP